MANQPPPLVLSPEELEKKRIDAAAEAARFLTSKEGNFSAAPPPEPPQQSFVPAGPPPPPPDQGGTGERQGPDVPPVPPAIQARMGVLGGGEGETPPPAPPPPGPSQGWRFEGGKMTGAPADYPGKVDTAPAAPLPPELAGTGERQPEGGGGAPPPMGGGGGGVIPGGFYPDKMVTSAKLGKPVPPEAKLAYGAAAGLNMRAAEGEANANQQFHNREVALYQQKLQSQQQAIADQQALQAQKDAEVQARLDRIQSLNKDALQKPEDIFGEKQIAARALSALFGGLGLAFGGKAGGILAGTGAALNNLVNEDINAKMVASKSAGLAAAREGDLLDKYMKMFDDKKKAIDATKLAYWDSLQSALDMYSSENKAQLDPVKLQQRQADILEQRAEVVNRLGKQEAAEVEQQYSQKFHMPQAYGGGGGGGGSADAATQTITIPDGTVQKDGQPGGTTYHVSDKKLYQDAVNRLDASQHLVDINNQITQLRKETKEIGVPTSSDELNQRSANIARLKELEGNKIDFIENLHKQGVVREGEYPRKKELEGHATAGLEYGWDKPVTGPLREAEYRAGDAVIAQQNRNFATDPARFIKASGGQVVRPGYTIDAAGHLTPAGEYTGQRAEINPSFAPRGSRPMNPKEPVNTQGVPGRVATPRGPILGPTPAHHAGGSRSHKKKEEE